MSKVLVCDDELMNRKVASKILLKEGFEVVEAINGKEALSVLKTTQVELILMDLMMPEMDGYKAINMIKADENLSHIPLIIISALSKQDAISKGLTLGANEYISKPFNITEFVFKIRTRLCNV